MNMTKKESLYRFTYEAFNTLSNNFEKYLEHYKNPDADFIKLLNENGISNYKEPIGVHIIKPIKLELIDNKPTHMADIQALDFYNSFEGMTPRLASDPRVLAYLNHFYLHKYGIARWPVSASTKPKHMRKHWLTSSTENTDIYKSNISGRTWWIAHMAIKAAESSAGTFDAKQALKKFTESPEYYHRTMEYAILKNNTLMAEFIRALHKEAEGINRDGYRAMAMELNREAGARLIDSLDRQYLRKLVQRAADHQMCKPESVTDRKYIHGVKKFKVLSLGAGAQSTVLALMAEEGWNGLEKPDLAIFADTQWEPPNVYEHLDWLEKHLSYEIVRVSAGNIRENILNGVNSDGDKFMDIPAFLVNPNGSKSVARRQCTTHYKIRPIHKELRKRLSIPAGRRAPKDVQVEMWLGISADESNRIKPSRDEWINNRYPLIEKDMTRANIYNWFSERYPDHHLPRSACVGCPYHSNMEWKWLKENMPNSFDEAVNVDWSLRNVQKVRGSLRGEAYLHHTRVQLNEVDFSDTENYDDFMASECEGLCGV